MAEMAAINVREINQIKRVILAAAEGHCSPQVTVAPQTMVVDGFVPHTVSLWPVDVSLAVHVCMARGVEAAVPQAEGHVAFVWTQVYETAPVGGLQKHGQAALKVLSSQ